MAGMRKILSLIGNDGSKIRQLDVPTLMRVASDLDHVDYWDCEFTAGSQAILQSFVDRLKKKACRAIISKVAIDK